MKLTIDELINKHTWATPGSDIEQLVSALCELQENFENMNKEFSKVVNKHNELLDELESINQLVDVSEVQETHDRLLQLITPMDFEHVCNEWE